jgi:hypothetical protein
MTDKKIPAAEPVVEQKLVDEVVERLMDRADRRRGGDGGGHSASKWLHRL